MSITKLNEVIAAAAKHGFPIEIKPDGNHVKVLQPVGFGAFKVVAAHARPDVALEAIQRAITPQPEKYFTLDEAIGNSTHTLPWRVEESGHVVSVCGADGGVLCSSNPDHFDDDSGLDEPDAILAAHCVTQLPRLLAAVRAFRPGDDISPLRDALLAADRVPGKVVVP